MTTKLEQSIVRIYSITEKDVVGSGFLVSDKYVLTCAHVVNFALHLPGDNSEQPTAEVNLDFPRVAPGKIIKAKVDLWLSMNPYHSPEDIAGLELLSSPPNDAQPAHLIPSDNLTGHPFRTWGFPNGKINGAVTNGKVCEELVWRQLDIPETTNYRLEPGFSGAPVWDEELQGVVGMAVAAELDRPEVRAGFMIPMTQLFKVLPVFNQCGNATLCPYQGLSAFTEKDAAYFFGRETFTQQLFQAVHKQSLVAVIGASGSGKSSVVFAGLIPKLRSEKGWLIEAFRPGDRPLRNLAAKLVPLLETEISETDQQDEINKQAEKFRLRNIGLRDVIERILQKKNCAHLLLIVDQFEELYTLCQENSERQAFLEQLLEAVKQAENFKLVLTLRADFYGYALSHDPFVKTLQDTDRKLLGPMNREELQKAIEKPAQLLGVQLESGLTERILEAVGHKPGNLPLLEFALKELWQRQYQRQLTHQAYEEIGKVEKALTNYAETYYQKLSPKDQERAQRVFIQLVQPNVGTEDTRKLSTRTEIGEENWGLVISPKDPQGLANARLVVTNTTREETEKNREETEKNREETEKNREETVEVVHEALIQKWERFQEWIETNREFRTWQERLKVQLREWKNANQDDGVLLRGTPLLKAEEWQQQHSEQLSEDQQFFIQRSRALQELKIQQERLRKRRIIIGLTGFSATILILLGLTGWQWRWSEIRQLNTELLSISKESENLFNNHKGLEALTKAQEAGEKLKQTLKFPLSLWLNVEPDTEIQVKAALLQAVYGIIERNRLQGHYYRINSVSISPNGKLIVSASDDNTIRLWNADGSLIKTIDSHKDNVNSVSFSPDGQIFASAGNDDTIRLWNTDGSLTKTIDFHKDDVNSVNFSPDGQLFASASDDGTIQIFYRNGTWFKTLLGHEDGVRDVRFSPDGQMIASAGQDGTVRLWNLDGELLETFDGHDNWVMSISFSPEGQMIASASKDATIKLWNLKDRKLDRTIKGEAEFNKVTFSPDNKMIASGSNNNTIQLWDIETGNLLQTLRGHLGDQDDQVTDVIFSTDGSILASAGSDNTIRIWQLDNHPGMLIVKGWNGTDRQSNKVTATNLSFDSQMIAIATEDIFNRDYAVELWNMKGKKISSLKDINSRVNSVSLSYNNQMIATASENGMIKIWSIDGNLIKTIEGHKKRINSIKFSPNSQMIVTASDDGTIKLWSTEGKLIIKFKKNTNKVDKAVFSPNGQSIASAHEDNSIYIWELDGTLKSKIERAHDDAITDIDFNSNGSILASISRDSKLKLWSVNGNNQQSPLIITADNNSPIFSVNFRPDNQVVATIEDNDKVKLTNSETGQSVIIKGITKNDESKMLSASFISNRTIILFLENGNLIRLDFDLNHLLKLGQKILN